MKHLIKNLFLASILILLYSCSSPTKKSQEENTVHETSGPAKNDQIGMLGEPLERQSFNLMLPNFGPVQFVTTTELSEVHFYLVKDGKAIYEFPKLIENTWNLEEVTAIGFEDLNMDGSDDIIVMTKWSTGAGPEAAVPFAVNGVYLSHGEDSYYENQYKNYVFGTYEKLNDILTTGKELTTISAIKKAAKDQINKKTVSYGLESLPSFAFVDWRPEGKMDYRGKYHFGFSESEWNLAITFLEGTIKATKHYNEWGKDDEGNETWLKKSILYQDLTVNGSKVYDKAQLLFEFVALKDFVGASDIRSETFGIIFHESKEFGSYLGPNEPLGKYPKASYKLIKNWQLDGLSKEELQIMRNEIFARHSYRFKSGGKMEHYFKAQSWYDLDNTVTDVSHLLTTIEKANIDLIKAFERKK